MSKIIIENAIVVTMNDKRETYRPGHIGIEKQKIEIVSENPITDDQWEDAHRIDGSDRIAIPGLINCHTHAGMTMMRGIADDMPLMEWLTTKIWPMEEKMTPEDVYWGTKLAVLEMIRGGVTCFCDMYWHSGQAALACGEVGIRAVLSGVLIATQEDAEEQMNRAIDIVSEWSGKDSERISFFFGPHALYTCPPDYLERIVASAKKLSTGIHIHLAETAQEVEECKKEYGGKSPIQVLEETGVFSRPTIAAHCIHLSEQDMDILASRKVSAIHNPSSNMKLASGIMPVERLLDAGINVALGTDSAASNNNLSILTEMRLASLLQKVNSGDPSALPAFRILDLATRNGAVAIGKGSILGQIEPGFDADIVLIQTNRIHSSPLNDPISHLVYCLRPDDVDTVFIGGEMILKSGQFLNVDVDEVLEKSKVIIDRIRV